jgi:hypothetical protein
LEERVLPAPLPIVGVFRGHYHDTSVFDGHYKTDDGFITLIIRPNGGLTSVSAGITGAAMITGFAGQSATLPVALGFEQRESNRVYVSVQAEADGIDLGNPGFLNVEGMFRGRSIVVAHYNVNGIGGYSTAYPDPHVVLGTPPPRPRPTATIIATARDLASEVFRGYDGRPIRIAQVLNVPKNDPTYLVTLSGTELFNLAQATTVPEDTLAEIDVHDAFYRVALHAIRATVPRGSRLILAGHSLGGMEIQNLVNDPALNDTYQVTDVIVFGTPKTKAPLVSGIRYRVLELVGDPVPALATYRWPSFMVDSLTNPWEHDPGAVYGHLEYPHSTLLGTAFDGLGTYHGKTVLKIRIVETCPAPRFGTRHP